MKKKFLMAAIVALCFSCNKKPENKTEETTDLGLNTKSVDANYVEVVKQYFYHFNNHNWRAMAEMYTDTAEFKDPSFGNGVMIQTKDQIITKYAELQATFSDINDVVIDTYPSGKNVVVVEFISSGTAPDSSRFELPICTIFTFDRNGKISKDYTYYDNF